MPRALSPTEQDYSNRLFHAVLDAIVELNCGPGANQGTVMPDIVRMTLADVAAIVDHGCGAVTTGAERRRNANAVATRYAKAVKSWQDMPGQEDWPQALSLQ